MYPSKLITSEWCSKHFHIGILWRMIRMDYPVTMENILYETNMFLVKFTHPTHKPADPVKYVKSMVTDMIYKGKVDYKYNKDTQIVIGMIDMEYIDD